MKKIFMGIGAVGGVIAPIVATVAFAQKTVEKTDFKGVNQGLTAYGIKDLGFEHLQTQTMAEQGLVKEMDFAPSKFNPVKTLASVKVIRALRITYGHG